MKEQVDDRSRRAQQRGRWPVRKYSLAKAPQGGATASMTASERIASMWQLALDAWAFCGRELPTYTRAETPIRVLRRPNPHGSGFV